MVHVSLKNIWIGDGKRIYKLNILQLNFHRPMTDDNDGVTRLLYSLKIYRSGGISGVHLTDVLSPNDPRSWSSEFEIAKTKEVQRLVRRNAI